MIDPLFGSLAGSLPWSGIPSPGFTWSPAPFGIAGRQPGMGTEGIGVSQIPQSVAAAAFGLPSPAVSGPLPTSPTLWNYGAIPQPYGLTGSLMAPWLPGLGPGVGIRPPVPFAVPGFVPHEMMGEVSAPTLVAIVAFRRGQPQGPTNDREAEEFMYDVLDMLPGTNEVEVRCEGGRITLTGSVQHKKIKRDVGEICWATPGVNDVENTVTIIPRRRTRAGGSKSQA